MLVYYYFLFTNYFVSQKITMDFYQVKVEIFIDGRSYLLLP